MASTRNSCVDLSFCQTRNATRDMFMVGDTDLGWQASLFSKCPVFFVGCREIGAPAKGEIASATSVGVSRTDCL